MQPALISSYVLLFAIVTLYRLNCGIFLFFLLLPTYMIRFSIGPIPTTVLEVMFLIIFTVWFLKKTRIQEKQKHKRLFSFLFSLFKNHKSITIGSTLFLLAATISIFTSVDIRAAAGEWKAFYIEPFLLFLVLTDAFAKKEKDAVYGLQENILLALILSGLATALLAIYQHFTGWMVPPAFWENRNTFRVTGWYGFPNGVGLFLAPIVPLAIYLAKQSFGAMKKKSSVFSLQSSVFFLCTLFLLTAPLAILFAKSTGAIVGVTAGIVTLLLFSKKTRWPSFAIGIIGLVSLVSLPNLAGLKDEIFMQDRSGQIRIAMWKEAVQLIKDRPILGAGLASYDERITQYHTTVNGEGVEIFHHPHNLFLTFWLNLGVFGLLGFLIIVVWFFKSIFIIQYSLFTQFLLSAMVIIIVTGLVDSPYIKNDLAIFFWLLQALLISIREKKKGS
ncbi:MAG: O-antigen ligase family protein [Candidatus Magasanikbacteria bacterium]